GRRPWRPGRRVVGDGSALALRAVGADLRGLRLARGGHRAAAARRRRLPRPQRWTDHAAGMGGAVRRLRRAAPARRQALRLARGGLVDHPQKLSLSDLRALPSVTQYVTLECISNDVGGDLISTGSFTGVRMSDLIAMASPRSSGTWAAFEATDGYSESLPMSL